MEKIDQIVRENVLSRLKRLGMTQIQLAAKAKLSVEGLNRAISGRHPAGRSTLEAIAKVLGCTVSDLYEAGPSAIDQSLLETVAQQAKLIALLVNPDEQLKTLLGAWAGLKQPSRLAVLYVATRDARYRDEFLKESTKPAEADPPDEIAADLFQEVKRR